MEKFGQFIGQLIFAAIYMLLAAFLWHLATKYVICFSIGMFFIAISSNLMEDHNGVGRIIVRRQCNR